MLMSYQATMVPMLTMPLLSYITCYWQQDNQQRSGQEISAN